MLFVKNTENGIIPVTARQRSGFSIFFSYFYFIRTKPQIYFLPAFHFPGTKRPFMYINTLNPHLYPNEVCAIIIWFLYIRKQSHRLP